jgi:hypothetical protein
MPLILSTWHPLASWPRLNMPPRLGFPTTDGYIPWVVRGSANAIIVSLHCFADGNHFWRREPVVWERPNFFESSAISKSLDSCLETSNLTAEDIDLYDLYSYAISSQCLLFGHLTHTRCFPIVPKLACHHLGLSITKPQKPLSLLGGLTSFGGAGNNYSMHVCPLLTLLPLGVVHTDSKY